MNLNKTLSQHRQLITIHGAPKLDDQKTERKKNGTQRKKNETQSCIHGLPMNQPSSLSFCYRPPHLHRLHRSSPPLPRPARRLRRLTSGCHLLLRAGHVAVLPHHDLGAAGGDSPQLSSVFQHHFLHELDGVLRPHSSNSLPPLAGRDRAQVQATVHKSPSIN